MIKNSSTAPHTRIYAIGDIHGRDDLFVALLNWVENDVQDAGTMRTVLVLLGDYVDRGPQSPGVLDRLIAGFPFMMETVYLCGNHEETLLKFLDSEPIGWRWFKYGGLETLQSYGVAVSNDLEEASARSEELRDDLSVVFPPEHKKLLENLEVQWTDGDYLFVHGGVRPGVALADQTNEDMMWIREEFLDNEESFGKIIIHGHTIKPDPVIKSNRIGIDTGAWESGRLSCLVLEGTSRRIACTDQGRANIIHIDTKIVTHP